MITGENSSAQLEHHLTGAIMGGTRTVDDKYIIGADHYSIKGSATVSTISPSLLSAQYDVVKNDGAVDKVTVVAQGVQLSNTVSDLPVCGGSISYTTESGLLYVKTLPVCPVVVIPPLPPGFPPGLPFPGLPIPPTPTPVP
jgi:hypothetical protein